VLALISGSEAWGPVRLELDVLFPDDADNYLGLVYHYRESQVGGHARSDFGSLYIKGNGSYVRVNPWRDGNVSRLLYEEYMTPLEAEHAIRIGEWHRVALEVMGAHCHLYVGDSEVPVLTFGLYEATAGALGFNPRVAGAPVWIDNVVATSIDRLSYTGPPIPRIRYHPDLLITDWQAIGPFAGPVPEIEGAIEARPLALDGDHAPYAWRPFETDPRGAVITGAVTEFEGPHPVAYFRTLVHAERARAATLHVSSSDELALWVNGSFHGYIYRNGYVFGDRDWNVWHDLATNPEHEATLVDIDLLQGENEILLRARNGQFASGGFFAHLRPRR
jgi:hypothetical protein